jgi:hypothetical protein
VAPRNRVRQFHARTALHPRAGAVVSPGTRFSSDGCREAHPPLSPTSNLLRRGCRQAHPNTWFRVSTRDELDGRRPSCRRCSGRCITQLTRCVLNGRRGRVGGFNQCCSNRSPGCFHDTLGFGHDDGVVVVDGDARYPGRRKCSLPGSATSRVADRQSRRAAGQRSHRVPHHRGIGLNGIADKHSVASTPTGIGT